MKIGLIEFTAEDLKGFVRVIKEIFIRLRLPRNKKDKIGIVIAIKTENEIEKIKLHSNLITELRAYLQNSDIPAIFNIIPLEEVHAQNINDGATALLFLRRIRGHFLVYGQMIKGKMDNGQLHYKFHLEGAVIHRPISKFFSDQLSKEFAELLPRRVIFSENEEILGFEFTQQWLGLVTKYIIGIAAFLSGDLNLSLKIYSQLNLELENYDNGIQAIVEIKKRLPRRFYEVATAFSFKYYFLIEKDLKKSMFEINRIKNPLDVTWRYSLAFLYAYKEDVLQAKRQYDKACIGYVDGNVISDCELFISDILKEEPNSKGLYFLRGYLNFKIKKDFILAKNDFEEFLRRYSSPDNCEIIKLVKIYLEQCK